MPFFDLATIDRQQMIYCSFSFCRNGRKTHSFCPNSIQKRNFDDRSRELSATS